MNKINKKDKGNEGVLFIWAKGLIIFKLHLKRFSTRGSSGYLRRWESSPSSKKENIKHKAKSQKVWKLIKKSEEKMKSFLVLCLILSLIVGTGRAEDSGFSGVGKGGDSTVSGGIDCLVMCGLICLTGPVKCALCIGKCLIFPVGSNQGDNLSFCKLGCATSRCTKFLTNGHPGPSSYFLIF